LSASDLRAIVDKLEAVRAKAPESKACALVTLGPPLAIAEVARIEEAIGVALPEDFRAFVTEIGNGGTSNGYRLLPLGTIDFGYGEKPWLGNDEYVRDARSPFPYREPWNWDEQRLEGVFEGHDELTKAYWAPVDGAIPLAAESDYQHEWLVVSGPERGNVWHDGRIQQCGWCPWLDAESAHRSFRSWYEGLLDAALAPRRYRMYTRDQFDELERRYGSRWIGTPGRGA
jgi:hypothetical protein